MSHNILADSFIDCALHEDRSQGQTLFRLYQRCVGMENYFYVHITAPICTGNLLASGPGGWDFQNNNIALGPLNNALGQINLVVSNQILMH